MCGRITTNRNPSRGSQGARASRSDHATRNVFEICYLPAEITIFSRLRFAYVNKPAGAGTPQQEPVKEVMYKKASPISKTRLLLTT